MENFFISSPYCLHLLRVFSYFTILPALAAYAVIGLLFTGIWMGCRRRICIQINKYNFPSKAQGTR